MGSTQTKTITPEEIEEQRKIKEKQNEIDKKSFENYLNAINFKTCYELKFNAYDCDVKYDVQNHQRSYSYSIINKKDFYQIFEKVMDKNNILFIVSEVKDMFGEFGDAYTVADIEKNKTYIIKINFVKVPKN